MKNCWCHPINQKGFKILLPKNSWIEIVWHILHLESMLKKECHFSNNLILFLNILHDLLIFLQQSTYYRHAIFFWTRTTNTYLVHPLLFSKMHHEIGITPITKIGTLNHESMYYLPSTSLCTIEHYSFMLFGHKFLLAFKQYWKKALGNVTWHVSYSFLGFPLFN